MCRSTKFKDYIRNTFIFYAIVIIVSIFILFITAMFFNFRSTVVRTNKTYNDLLGEFIDDQFSIYEKGIKLLSEERDIIDVLIKGGNLAEANNLLYQHSNSQKINADFALFDKYGKIVATSLYEKNQEMIKSSNEVKSIINFLLTNKDRVYKDINNIKFEESQKSNFLYATIISDGDEPVGFLIYWLRTENFDEFIRYKNVDIVIITDQFNNSIYSTNDIIINSMGKINLAESNNNTFILDEQMYYITINEIQGKSVKVITMISIQKHQQFLLLGLILLLASSIFMVILVTILSPKVTKRNLKSLDSLIYAIDKLKDGNIDYTIQSETFDEFQGLYQDFDIMMSRIKMLIKSNYEIAERKRQMEIKHLESQFNPHFIFNVMETLRYEILFEPELASSMVVSFANLMRYNINYGSTEVLLRIDLEYIEDYLKIQKMRFGNRLSYKIDIDESLYNCMTPKLLLQPIIENSIKYGIESTDNLYVNITITKSGNDMCISVEDNGQGIEAEKLTNLNSLIRDATAMPSNIGLYNAHRIIRLLYGESYGLNIVSEYGIGTIVVLTIPIIKHGDELNEKSANS